MANGETVNDWFQNAQRAVGDPVDHETGDNRGDEDERFRLVTDRQSAVTGSCVSMVDAEFTPGNRKSNCDPVGPAIGAAKHVAISASRPKDSLVEETRTNRLD